MTYGDFKKQFRGTANETRVVHRSAAEIRKDPKESVRAESRSSTPVSSTLCSKPRARRVYLICPGHITGQVLTTMLDPDRTGMCTTR